MPMPNDRRVLVNSDMVLSCGTTFATEKFAKIAAGRKRKESQQLRMPTVAKLMVQLESECIRHDV